jgi:hypothetical protein
VLTNPQGLSCSSWQNPVGSLALCASVSASVAPTGTAAKRRRLVNLDLPALKLAGTSEVKAEPPRETHYSQNGQSMERIQEVMRGRCGCKRDCFTKVSPSAVKAVCDMFWALPSEEQSFLAGDSAAPRARPAACCKPATTNSCHTLEQQLLNRPQVLTLADGMEGSSSTGRRTWHLNGAPRLDQSATMPT